MWSYFTSHTRSMRSGSHDRSLPALHRLWPPGMRWPTLAISSGVVAAMASTHSRQGCAAIASFRNGSSSSTSCLRFSIVNEDVTPT